MNLSAQFISPRPARLSSNDKAAPIAAPSAEQPKGEFADFFADVAQRSEPAEKKGKSSAADFKGTSHHGAGTAAKSSSRHADEQKKLAKKLKSAAEVDASLLVAEVPLSPPAPAAGLSPCALSDAETDSNATSSNAEGSGVGAAGLPVEMGDASEIQPAPMDNPVGEQTAVVDLAKQPGSADDAAVQAVAGLESPKAANDVANQHVRVLADAGTTSDLKKNFAAKAAAGKTTTAKQKADGAADFADETADREEGRGGDGVRTSRNFLTTSDKEVTQRNEALGINVAKLGVEMSPDPLPQEAKAFFATHPAVREVGSSAEASKQNSLDTAVPVLADAHVAVEAAMEASEKISAANQRTVNLKFSTGGGDLSVRVELHEGQVRATFRTDSAELRSALAHEWQTLTNSNNARAQRFADPVFASASWSSTSGNGSENHGQPRGQEARQPTERFEFSPGLRAATAAPEVSAASPASLYPAQSLTALRLHTFA